MAPLVQGSDFFFDKHSGPAIGVTSSCAWSDAGGAAAKSIKLFLNRSISRSPGLSRNVGANVAVGRQVAVVRRAVRLLVIVNGQIDLEYSIMTAKIRGSGTALPGSPRQQGSDGCSGSWAEPFDASQTATRRQAPYDSGAVSHDFPKWHAAIHENAQQDSTSCAPNLQAAVAFKRD